MATTRANEEQVFDGLIRRGFSPLHAAVVAGNIASESRYNPSALNEREGAYGLLQWRLDRRTGLEQFAAATGRDPSDIDAQLDWLAYEMGGPEQRNAAAFLASTDPLTANTSLRDFIRYAPGTEDERLSNAQQVMARANTPTLVAQAGPTVSREEALRSLGGLPSGPVSAPAAPATPPVMPTAPAAPAPAPAPAMPSMPEAPMAPEPVMGAPLPPSREESLRTLGVPAGGPPVVTPPPTEPASSGEGGGGSLGGMIADGIGGVMGALGKQFFTPEGWDNTLGNIAQASRSFASGIPIISPIGEWLGSQLASFLPAELQPGGVSRTPEEILATYHDRLRENAERYPAGNVAGQAAGIMLPLGALGATATGGKLLGATGPLTQRAAMGGVSGATIAGADTGLRGGSPEDVITNMLLGGFGSAGANALIRGNLPSRFLGGGALAGSIAGMLDADPQTIGLAALTGGLAGAGGHAALSGGNRLTGIGPTRATRAVADAMTADDLTPFVAANRLMDLGPEGRVADLGPNLGRLASTLASLPGEAQAIVRSTLSKRATTANERVRSTLDATLGRAPVPEAIRAEINAGKERLGDLYTLAFAGAQDVNTSRLAAALDQLIPTLRGDAQKSIRDVRAMLDVTGQRGTLETNPSVLFQVRHAIDDTLMPNLQGNAARQMTLVRNAVDEVLAASVPSIKTIDAQWAELMRQGGRSGREGAFQEGQQLLDSGRTAMRPEELRNYLIEAANPTGTLVGPSGVPFRLSQGARAEIDRIIGTNANDVQALQRLIKGEGDWNRERLALLFGQDRADELMRIVDREVAFANTNRLVTGGPQTAERLAGQRALGEVNVEIPKTTTAYGHTMNALTGAANRLLNADREFVNADIARLLMGSYRDMSPQLMSRLENALMRPTDRVPNFTIVPPTPQESEGRRFPVAVPGF